MYGPQVKLVLLTFGFFLLQWQAIDSRPVDTHGRYRRTFEFDAAHLGALVEDEPQKGILNEKCVPLYDCQEIFEAGSNKSGLYRIDPGGLGDFTVFCDMELLGGGWTVIQRRVDNSVSFDHPWKFYRNGFGDFGGNFWLGLNKIKRITDMNTYELYIGLEDQEYDATNTAWTRYGSFSLGSEESHYRLHIGGYDNNSTAGNGLSFHSGQPFSTSDRDNDAHHTVHCSQTYKGGWWFKDCHKSNLNGVWYARGDNTRSEHEGVVWKTWLNNASLKTTVMAIRMPTSTSATHTHAMANE